MKLPIVGQAVDERFLAHRLRASSLGGIAGGVLAILLFYYRYYHDHVWSWDLVAVALTIVGVKLAVMGWYLFTD
jgi:protein-S-isoprenylcysteine O-methyltransferase Ste14